MNKELKYGGFTAVPSDYECPDGDLAAALNLIPEDGALHPIAPPLQLATLPQETSIVHIHKAVGLSHYIFEVNRSSLDSPENGIYWLDTSTIEDFTPKPMSEQDLEEELFSEGAGMYLQRIVDAVTIPIDTIRKIDSIGNTLVVLTSRGTFFFLWQNGAYLSLGQKPDAISVWYDVRDYTERQENQSNVYEHLWASSKSDKISGLADNVITNPNGSVEQRDKVREYSDYIFACINNARQYARRANLFISPFFIRLAYRTTSGTHIMHTAPFLVVPDANGKPFVFLGIDDDKKYAYADFNAVSVVLGVNAVPANWKDIIEGIDIFITPEIQAYTEDPVGIDAPIEMTRVSNELRVGGVAYPIYDYVSVTNFGNYGTATPAGKNDLNESLYSKTSWQLSISNDNKTAYLPLVRADRKSISDLVKEEHRFYLYKTLTPEFFGTDAHKSVQIALDEMEYASLTTRETLDDDYLSRDGLIARSSFVYNNRLNLALESRKLGKPDYLEHYAPIHQRTLTHSVVTGIYAKVSDSPGEYWTEIQGNGAVYTDPVKGCLWLDDIYYLFYPNLNAKEIRLKVIDGNSEYKYYSIPLAPHSTLNGAYAFNDFDALTVEESYVPDVNDIVPAGGKLYTSEVNMPFIFPAKNITQVGTGEILALSSATKALSQGQFGQFPLYAFTTDGVWALTVGDDGSFIARHPVTRDVVLNEDSVLQTDSAVVFAAQRGIMLLQGSEAVCISEVLDGNPFAVTTLPSCATLLTSEGFSACQYSYIPFREFLKSSKYLYDYTHQRVVVFDPTLTDGAQVIVAHPYSYVFSLRSKQWGIMNSELVQALNSYPDSLAVRYDGQGNVLVDYAREGTIAAGSTGAVKDFLITRPLKMDGADILKTIDAVIQRGYFARGNVKSVLYGSNDLLHWLPVWSSVDHELRGFRGTPYKYYRVMLVGNLLRSESIYGMSLSVETRQTNRLR